MAPIVTDSATPRQGFTCGPTIRSLRTLIGLSREQLAQRASISPSMVGRLERDQAPWFASVLVDRVCFALAETLAERDASREAASAV